MNKGILFNPIDENNKISYPTDKKFGLLNTSQHNIIIKIK